MKTLSKYSSEHTYVDLHEEFCQYVDRHASSVNEGVFDFIKSAPTKLKPAFDLIKSMSEIAKQSISDLIKMFTDSKVFEFFKKISFSLNTLINLLKDGFSLYKQLLQAISEYAASLKIVKWTESHLKDLDKWLAKHPKFKRLAGMAVAALLIFIWFNMSFTGDTSYDFDLTDALSAMSGTFSISKIFGGADGMKLLMLFATGLLGLTFPWPGPASAKFVITILKSVGKKWFSKLSVNTT